MGNKKNNNDNQKTELEQLNLDSQDLKTEPKVSFFEIINTIMLSFPFIAFMFSEILPPLIIVSAVLLVLYLIALPFLSKKYNQDSIKLENINIKYGDNKATINVKHKNYDVYLSQVNRIEYERVTKEEKNRTLYAHKIKIHYGSENFEETLTLQDIFSSYENYECFTNSNFDYLFKFLTSKHGGRVIHCLGLHMPIVEEYEANKNAKSDFLPCISCPANSYQCPINSPSIGFVGVMTADFLSDRVVIQIPHNCFIAYYRDILNTGIKDEYFFLQYKNTMNFKIHIVNKRNLDKAEKIVKQLQDKIKEYYI